MIIWARGRHGRRQEPAVGTIGALYERFRHLIHEGAKFLVIGAVGTVVTFGVANSLQSIGNYKAVTIATILATVVTYLGNRYWTFRDRQNQSTGRETVIFLVLNGVGLLIYYGCIWLMYDLPGLKGKLWYNAALVVGTGLGTLFRFWSYRKWVWMAPETPVLSRAEPDDEMAQDLAAVIGAAPAHPELPRADGQQSRSASAARPARVPASHRRTR